MYNNCLDDLYDPLRKIREGSFGNDVASILANMSSTRGACVCDQSWRRKHQLNDSQKRTTREVCRPTRGILPVPDWIQSARFWLDPSRTEQLSRCRRGWLRNQVTFSLLTSLCMITAWSPDEAVEALGHHLIVFSLRSGPLGKSEVADPGNHHGYMDGTTR